MNTAPVSEIFSSVQGEGLHLGERQIFIRFAGCPWRCTYCDTPGSLLEAGFPVLNVDTVLRQVEDLQKVRHHPSVSLTGGEPLLRADFLKVLIPELKKRGLSVHLETSATHPHLFEKIASLCDVVAADIKLPSAIGRPFWEEHAAFLALAGNRAFVKIVLTAETAPEEMTHALNLLSALRPPPPLFLQPVTPLREEAMSFPSAPRPRPPSPGVTQQFFEQARRCLPSVKLVPQMHPIWGVP